MKKAVQKLLVTINQGVQFMRECKNHMEVRGVYDFRPAFVHPDFFHDRLTVGAVPVPAGVVMDFGMPAVRTPAGIVSKPPGFAVQNGMGSFSLYFRLEMPGGTVILIRCFPYLPDVRVTQGKRLIGANLRKKCL